MLHEESHLESTRPSVLQKVLFTFFLKDKTPQGNRLSFSGSAQVKRPGTDWTNKSNCDIKINNGAHTAYTYFVFPFSIYRIYKGEVKKKHAIDHQLVREKGIFSKLVSPSSLGCMLASCHQRCRRQKRFKILVHDDIVHIEKETKIRSSFNKRL